MEQTLFGKYDVFFNKGLFGVTNVQFDENTFLQAVFAASRGRDGVLPALIHPHSDMLVSQWVHPNIKFTSLVRKLLTQPPNLAERVGMRRRYLWGI